MSEYDGEIEHKVHSSNLTEEEARDLAWELKKLVWDEVQYKWKFENFIEGEKKYGYYDSRAHGYSDSEKHRLEGLVNAILPGAVAHKQKTTGS